MSEQVERTNHVSSVEGNLVAIVNHHKYRVIQSRGMDLVR